jgi:replicative DNA helicase
MTAFETIPRKNFITMTDIKLKPLKIKFDITTLNMVISFIYKDSVLRTRKTLTNIYKLFTNLDESLYDQDELLKARIWLIQKTLYGKLIDGFENDENLKQYCLDDIGCDELRANTLINILETKKISHDESKYLIKKIDDTLEYGYTVTVKDIIKEILATIDDGDFKSYKSVSEDLYDIATAVINIKRNTTSLGSDQTFSLADEQFDAVIEDAVQKLKDRNRIFITGIQRLNTILAPGYLSKRLYTYLAFPGKGKSTILLKSAIDIRKYNKGIKTKDPDKRPAVLFLTLENDIPETIERIYNMCVDSDDIRNYSPKQIKKKMKEKGGLKLTDGDNIDIIIKEYKNRELDTNDLYTLINDLSDEGIEVITLVLDYMKRIRPAEKAKDEKTELKNITNELKEVAKFFDIPVITAQQLNRVGASVVDAAIQAKKEDVTKLVGRDAIAGAWEVIENSDVVIIVNPETKSDTGELFLTFKLLKRRYRSSEENEKLRRLEYFNHPFEPGNEICLIDDIELDKPLSLESLATQFEAVDGKRGPENAVKRESKDKGPDKRKLFSDNTNSEFDPFDFDKMSNY